MHVCMHADIGWMPGGSSTGAELYSFTYTHTESRIYIWYLCVHAHAGIGYQHGCRGVLIYTHAHGIVDLCVHSHAGIGWTSGALFTDAELGEDRRPTPGPAGPSGTRSESY